MPPRWTVLFPCLHPVENGTVQAICFNMNRIVEPWSMLKTEYDIICALSGLSAQPARQAAFEDVYDVGEVEIALPDVPVLTFKTFGTDTWTEVVDLYFSGELANLPPCRYTNGPWA